MREIAPTIGLFSTELQIYMPLLTKLQNTRPFLTFMEKVGGYFEKAIPVILALILGLIVWMAVSSGFDHHPDEKDHYGAAAYYLNHWLPPPIGAPETRESYSRYGYSYLNELDIVYLLTAKFSHLLSPLISKKYLAMRFFNVFLFFLLVLYCFFNPESRPVFLVILITPQVWYIFSYINSDSISFFISLIVTCEVLIENSFFQSSLRTSGPRQFIPAGVFMGLLLGLLFLSKRNYYIFILFIFFIISWQIWQNRDPSQKQMILRYLAVIGFGLSLFLCRYGYDLAVNGWGKADKTLAYAEKIAQTEFKPSIRDSANSYYGLRLRSKGLSYSELFSKWEWHKISFKSFFGVYEYMKIFSSGRYYKLVSDVLWLFLIYITASMLIKGEMANKIFMLIVWTFISLCIFLSTYHSWVNDFQAQGRYLFPVLGMIGALLYQSRNILNKGLLAVFGMAFYGLATYSFIFTGLFQIQGYPQ